MREGSPWHPGEVALQAAAGVATRMDEIGRRTIRDHLIEQHRSFYPLLSMAVLGGVDGEGQVWATVRAGQPGFMHALDEHHLRIDLPRDGADPAEPGFDDGADAALLGIDLSTRRRNRLNGRVIRHNGGFSLRVEQSFGNCPKYIQLRQTVPAGDLATVPDVPPVELNELAGDALALVESVDTFFVATAVEAGEGRRAVDVSHRGGRPGFVEVEGNALVIPDYAGNLYFNTLGNILSDPRAGLAFLDFETGDLLQMTGRAEILPKGRSKRSAPGAERYWRFSPSRIVWRPGAVAQRWRLIEPSPYSPPVAP